MFSIKNIVDYLQIIIKDWTLKPFIRKYYSFLKSL